MINITILTKDWAELWTFPAEKGEFITTLATKNGIEIPMSCGAWACGLCLCEIVQWGQYIDKWNWFMALEDDQVLTCIATIKEEYLGDNMSDAVILKRTV